MSSINSNYLTAQSTANPIRRSSDAAAFRGDANGAGPATQKPQFRNSAAPTLDAKAIATTTPSSTRNVALATQNAAEPQRPLRPGSIINILV